MDCRLILAVRGTAGSGESLSLDNGVAKESVCGDLLVQETVDGFIPPRAVTDKIMWIQNKKPILRVPPDCSAFCPPEDPTLIASQNSLTMFPHDTCSLMTHICCLFLRSLFKDYLALPSRFFPEALQPLLSASTQGLTAAGGHTHFHESTSPHHDPTTPEYCPTPKHS